MLSHRTTDVRTPAPLERWVTAQEHRAAVANARSSGYTTGEMEGWLRGLGVGLLVGALMAGALALALMPVSRLAV